jgi:hypothetical protein
MEVRRFTRSSISNVYIIRPSLEMNAAFRRIMQIFLFAKFSFTDSTSMHILYFALQEIYAKLSEGGSRTMASAFVHRTNNRITKTLSDSSMECPCFLPPISEENSAKAAYVRDGRQRPQLFGDGIIHAGYG